MKDIRNIDVWRRASTMVGLVSVLLFGTAMQSIAQTEKGYLVRSHYFGDIQITARAGEEVVIRGIEQKNGQEHCKLTVRGRNTETTVLNTEVSRTDTRCRFRMSKPENVDGYLVGGVGQAVSIDRVVLKDENKKDLKLELGDIRSIEINSTTIVIQARDAVHRCPVVYRDSPGSQTHQNPFRLIAGEKEIQLTELAKTATVKLEALAAQEKTEKQNPRSATVSKGMDEQQVITAWGRPESITDERPNIDKVLWDYEVIQYRGFQYRVQFASGKVEKILVIPGQPTGGRWMDSCTR